MCNSNVICPTGRGPGVWLIFNNKESNCHCGGSCARAPLWRTFIVRCTEESLSIARFFWWLTQMSDDFCRSLYPLSGLRELRLTALFGRIEIPPFYRGGDRWGHSVLGGSWPEAASTFRNYKKSLNTSTQMLREREKKDIWGFKKAAFLLCAEKLIFEELELLRLEVQSIFGFKFDLKCFLVGAKLMASFSDPGSWDAAIKYLKTNFLSLIWSS